MSWRAIASQPGSYVVYNTDEMGRLLGIFAATDKDDFTWRAARIVAEFTERLPA